MAARDFVVRWLGEKIARKIEGFVNGTVFGEQSVICPRCGRPVPAALVVEREACPVCQKAAANETMIDALEAEKRAALATGTDATNQAEEIERRLSILRKEG